MKKVLAIALASAMVFSMAACGSSKEETQAQTEAETTAAETEAETTAAETEAAEDVELMDYAAFDEADVDAPVSVLMYVQAHQSWWDDKVTVYGADEDGAYFVYDMACSEEDAEKLEPGTAIIVTGYKAEWSGEIEISDATFEFAEGAESYVKDPIDCTDLFADEDALYANVNEPVKFTDVTVDAVAYKNDTPGDDIYVTVSKEGTSYEFCLEYYLNGDDEEFYETVGNLEAGSTVDIEGFLYWYEGPNVHLTAVTVK